MRKIFFGIVSAFALFLVASPVFAASPISYTFHVTNKGDTGTCDNTWAKDDYDETVTISDNGDGSYDVVASYVGTFVTLDGKSPGACESGSYNGHTVPAGINGTIVDEIWHATVTGDLNGGASCDPSICTSGGSVLDTYFNNYTFTSGWFMTGAHYTTPHNGSWYDTWTNWPQDDTGDITGIVYSVNGGGHLLEQADKRKNWHDVSLGGWVNKLQNNDSVGDFQVNFHNITDKNEDVNGKVFHGTDVVSFDRFDVNNSFCNDKVRFVLNGTLDGIPGYSVFVRMSDLGSPNVGDTVRVALYHSDDASSQPVYDTNGGDFRSVDSCLGNARTGLDKGNITITP